MPETAGKRDGSRPGPAVPAPKGPDPPTRQGGPAPPVPPPASWAALTGTPRHGITTQLELNTHVPLTGINHSTASSSPPPKLSTIRGCETAWIVYDGGISPGKGSHQDMPESQTSASGQTAPTPDGYGPELEATRRSPATCTTCGKPVTDQAAYDTACDQFNAIAGTYQARKDELEAQLQALHDAYDAASEHLALHEHKPGIGPKRATHQPEGSALPHLAADCAPDRCGQAAPYISDCARLGLAEDCETCRNGNSHV